MDKENSDVSSKPADVNVSTLREAFSVTRMPFTDDPFSKMRLSYFTKIKETIIKYLAFLWNLMDFTNLSLF